jgi:hypothetical protein
MDKRVARLSIESLSRPRAADSPLRHSEASEKDRFGIFH